MRGRMKKALSYVLRFGIAGAGILFIVLTLNWSDQVVVPPGLLPTPADEPVALEIVSASDAGVVARLPDGGELRLDPEQVGTGDDPDQARLRPGILTTLRGADVRLILVGLLMVGTILPIQAWRWYLLMRSQNIAATFARALRLTYVGMFFNICMPGMTGGDVARAYYAARGTDQRTKAIMSVIFDRAAGLLSLILLGAIAGLFVLDDPLAARVTLLGWLLLGALAIATAIYYSERGRRWLGLEWIIARLARVPKIATIDQAAQAYRHSKGAVLAGLALSLPVHVILAIACSLAGYALGLDHELGLMVAILPVVFLAGSLPISIQGIGVMEALLLALLLAPPVATANQLLGMLLIYRLFMIFWALVGSTALLGGSIRLHPEAQRV